jgi:hypothetical protein
MVTDSDNNGESETLADKIRGFREKAKRKKKKVRADKRAKARRIENEDPDSLSEKIAVKKRRAAEAKDEFDALTEEGKEVAELKFGVGGGDDGDGSGVFDALSEVGQSVGDAAENIGETDLSEPLVNDSGMMEPLDGDESIGVVDGPESGDISLDPAGDDVLMDADDEDEALDDLDPL